MCDIHVYGVSTLVFPGLIVNGFSVLSVTSVPFLLPSGCLRSWLEQEPVCPTCRRSLNNDLRSDEQPREERRGSNTPANQR